MATSAMDSSLAVLLPPAASLRTLPDAEVTSVLDMLFEPAADLHAVALPLIRGGATNPPISSYRGLADVVRMALLQLTDADALRRILAAHPRLGEKRVESALSRAEQRSLGGSIQSQAEETEAQRLLQLNEEYETRFPGLRYVVFVNGRPRTLIMEDMRKRIDRGDFAAEEKEAIKAMCDIAADRAEKLEARAAHTFAT